LAVTTATSFFLYTTLRLGVKLSLFQQLLVKVKNQQFEWHQRFYIQYYKIRNMLGNVQTVTVLTWSLGNVQTVTVLTWSLGNEQNVTVLTWSHHLLNCNKNHVAYIKT
jgi:hypothetical protein